VGVPVAAFDAGIQGSQVALQSQFGGLLVIEGCGHSLIITHNDTWFLLLGLYCHWLRCSRLGPWR
jgi:hypothetical protein